MPNVGLKSFTDMSSSTFDACKLDVILLIAAGGGLGNFIKASIMTSTVATWLGLTVLVLTLAACGNSPGDRAASGGLLGAGAGATIGALTGGGALTGALIGGGVGAVGGAVTSSDDVNLGRPAWR